MKAKPIIAGDMFGKIQFGFKSAIYMSVRDGFHDIDLPLPEQHSSLRAD